MLLVITSLNITHKSRIDGAAADIADLPQAILIADEVRDLVERMSGAVGPSRAKRAGESGQPGGVHPADPHEVLRALPLDRL